MPTQRPPSPLREVPTTGFQVLGNEYRLEEETWSWYKPEEYYPVRIGEVFKNKVPGDWGARFWLCIYSPALQGPSVGCSLLPGDHD